MTEARAPLNARNKSIVRLAALYEPPADSDGDSFRSSVAAPLLTHVLQNMSNSRSFDLLIQWLYEEYTCSQGIRYEDIFILFGYYYPIMNWKFH